MVYGFVKQSGGHIRIYSEVGEGTTVKIYLPRLTQVEETKAVPAAKFAGDSPLPRAAPQEALLVVEDNVAVRQYAKTCLEELGYTVFEAGDTAEALQILESGEPIDLLFTMSFCPMQVADSSLDTQKNCARICQYFSRRATRAMRSFIRAVLTPASNS